MKIDPYCQRQKCRPVILVSGSIRLMRIFAKFLWGGASNDSGVVDNVNFQRFRWLITSKTLEMRPSLLRRIYQYVVRRQLFSDPKMHDLDDPEWLFRVKFCFRAGLAAWLRRATFEE